MLVRITLIIGCLAVSVAADAQRPAVPGTTTGPSEPIRRNDAGVYALTNARIIVGVGRTIEKGSLVVRDRSLVAVGAQLKIPADAHIIDMSGKSIYPGLIDAYSSMELKPQESSTTHWNSLITPELETAGQFQPDAALNSKLRAQGITARLVAPASGIIKGFSAIVTTADDDSLRHVIKRRVAQHIRLTVPRGRGSVYPNSPMGAVALARQVFYDADWYGKAWKAYSVDRRLPKPEVNDALAALQDVVAHEQFVIIDAQNELYALRADRFAREFGLKALLRGSGNEYRRLEAIRKTGRPLIVPVNFPKPPNVGAVEAALNVPLEQLMHWDLAPENPSRMEKAGVTMALTSDGLAEPADFLKNVRRAIERGLSVDGALAALTSVPAGMLGIGDRAGSLETGKMASFVVTSGDLFSKDVKILETWVDGERYQQFQPRTVDPQGEWKLALNPPARPLSLRITGPPDDRSKPLSAKIVYGKKEISLLRVSMLDARLSGAFNSSELGHPGVAQLTLVVDAANGRAEGSLVWPTGETARVEATRTEAKPKPEKKKPEKKLETADQLVAENTASVEVNYPLGAFGRLSKPDQPQQVLFRNATIWTSGAKGVLTNASLLIGDGKILAVGADIKAPAGAIVIDASGKHISPGIIDCHSHMATDGGVNESGQAVTAEVRIGDFIDCDDINIYRQLAGGVTSSNILHGSANPIGGQNQVIKLRWGSLPEEMKFQAAPQGIKFALGENVKQSNRREASTRYPQSRMGVEQIILDEFTAAQRYTARWATWRREQRGLPPRRDLELDAVAEILAHKRWIHCHSYRQDEILMLIRLLDRFKVRIGTFQHILEGYKAADAMARHGAMGSAFSDWWAYKIEVYDAIPFNGALMHKAGVVVSFNSDDRELARHLNHEAAKAIKYGGVAPAEALKFVTLNPARQLRIEQYVGSLEVGKHADLVVWSASPLSPLSRCEQTWVDGRKYFDLADDAERRKQVQSLRARLVQKILTSGETMLKPGEQQVADEELWAREDTFCHHHEHRDGK